MKASFHAHDSLFIGPMGPETNGLMLQANPVTSTYKVKRCVQLKETIGQKEWQLLHLVAFGGSVACSCFYLDQTVTKAGPKRLFTFELIDKWTFIP